MRTSNTSLPVNSHFISLNQAISMTTTYRANREVVLDLVYQKLDILPLSETFNRQALDQLLATPGCEGLRIYYGMDENLKIHALMVAVNSSNQDMLPALAQTDSVADADDPVIVEEGQRCPPICPDDSPLNS